MVRTLLSRQSCVLEVWYFLSRNVVPFIVRYFCYIRWGNVSRDFVSFTVVNLSKHFASFSVMRLLINIERAVMNVCMPFTVRSLFSRGFVPFTAINLLSKNGVNFS